MDTPFVYARYKLPLGTERKMVSEIQKLRKPRPRLEDARNIRRFQKVFSESLLDCLKSS